MNCVPHSSALKKISSFDYCNYLSAVAIPTAPVRRLVFYGSEKISLNFSVIADSSSSKLLYLPLETAVSFEPD